MKKDEAMVYCEYCEELIVDHKNIIAIILARRENGIGVECDDCNIARIKKENELYDKQGFKEDVKGQYSLLTDASNLLKEYLDGIGSHFFPIEYDCYDLDGEIKTAKRNIDWMRGRIKKVFSRVFEEEWDYILWKMNCSIK